MIYNSEVSASSFWSLSLKRRNGSDRKNKKNFRDPVKQNHWIEGVPKEKREAYPATAVGLFISGPTMQPDWGLTSSPSWKVSSNGLAPKTVASLKHIHLQITRTIPFYWILDQRLPNEKSTSRICYLLSIKYKTYNVNPLQMWDNFNASCHVWVILYQIISIYLFIYYYLLLLSLLAYLSPEAPLKVAHWSWDCYVWSTIP